MMDDQPAVSLGLEILRLRQKAGFTLRKFAELIDVSPAHVSDIEHDRRRPSKEVLERVVQRLSTVGATHGGFDALNTRLEPDLQRWVAETPAARQLLRQVRNSGSDPNEVLRQLEELLAPPKPKQQ